MSKQQIEALSGADLIAIIRSTNPNGFYWQQLQWAKDEYKRRIDENINYARELMD